VRERQTAGRIGREGEQEKERGRERESGKERVGEKGREKGDEGDGVEMGERASECGCWSKILQKRLRKYFCSSTDIDTNHMVCHIMCVHLF